MAGTTRRPSDRTMNSRARNLAREVDRQERRAAKAEKALDEADGALGDLWLAERHRFGRDIPRDPLLLDVLALIDVDGDRWVWRGMRNNKGVPTIRYYDDGTPRKNHELSAVRYLALAFGVIQPSDYGTLHPKNGDTDDVNPDHRVLRRSARPLGKWDRYQGQ